MSQTIDRRLQGKNKSLGNRERFMERYKSQIREALRHVVSGRAIQEMDQGTEVRIPKRDMSEPVFRHGEGGVRDLVHTGNREHLEGDRIRRPQGAGQGSGNQASDSGEGEDDFVFQLNREEFMKMFFDELELPNLERSEIAEVQAWRSQRAGYVTDGTPNNLSVVRSMRGSLGRRIALTRDVRAQVREARLELEGLLESEEVPSHRLGELMKRIAELEMRKAKVPFLDPLDLRYRNRTQVPVPSSRAVMFCVMDVSGSMDETRKDLAKRFYVLLYLFLKRHYEKIEIVFIRHHTEAKEVGENEFFHAQEAGGTIVSSALELTRKIIQTRFSANGWNVYVAQASDGDNCDSDCKKCVEIMTDKLLPMTRYFAYLQVAEPEQSLWQAYLHMSVSQSHFAMRKATTPAHIFPVLADLFKKQGASP